jgi:hypothetical protein
MALLLRDPDAGFDSGDMRSGLLLCPHNCRFPKLSGKESCKKWQRSFFYAKNLLKDANHVNLPPFALRGLGERDSWKASLENPGPDMVNILKLVVALQGEVALKAPDLQLAFIGARVSPLQRRSHKMCHLGSNKDPTRNSSKVLSAGEVAQKANKIIEVKLLPKLKWGMKPTTATIRLQR